MAAKIKRNCDKALSQFIGNFQKILYGMAGMKCWKCVEDHKRNKWELEWKWSGFLYLKCPHCGMKYNPVKGEYL